MTTPHPSMRRPPLSVVRVTRRLRLVAPLLVTVLASAGFGQLRVTASPVPVASVPDAANEGDAAAVMSATALAEVSHALTRRQRAILDAIRMVECDGGDVAPDGDGGAAIGPYQIHRCYWLDAVRFAPELGGCYEDCRDRAYAERVVDAYMSRYARDAWQSGHAEAVARIHNGGPKGHTRQATFGYWQRVQQHLD